MPPQLSHPPWHARCSPLATKLPTAHLSKHRRSGPPTACGWGRPPHPAVVAAFEPSKLAPEDWLILAERQALGLIAAAH
jgi:hypothetical protein